MSRQSASTKTVQSWISDYPDLFFNGVELSCNVCGVTLSHTRKNVVVKHVSSKKHQTLIGGDKQKLFNVDLLKFMVGCDIPWRQLDNPMFREFIENCVSGQYAEVHLPSSTTLRKNYLPQVAENTICNIRSELEGKYIWVSVDETANACGQQISNILVGALDELHTTRAHLIASKVLERMNAYTMSTFVRYSLKLLWGDGFDSEENKDKFVLFITDNQAYMKATGRILKKSYNFLHIICLIHTLHQVAEMVKECYPKVDMLISSVKKAFHKAPERSRLFCEILPHVELPPEPIVTRWGTWLDAAKYYFIHLEDMKQVFQQLVKVGCSTETLTVANAQEAIMDPTIQGSLQEIHNLFSRIPLALRQLERYHQTDETDDLTLTDQMNVIYDLRQYISSLTGGTAERVKKELENVLELNPGFLTLSSIVKLLHKEEVDFVAPGIHELSLHRYSLFRYAPITSVDIERTFSLYKSIFSNKRSRLTPDNLEQILIIYFYHTAVTTEHSGQL